MDSGICRNAKDKKNKTTLDYARMWNISDISKYPNNLTKTEREVNIIMDGNYYSILGVQNGAQLNDKLRRLDIKNLYITGLSLDYSVLYTAIDNFLTSILLILFFSTPVRLRFSNNSSIAIKFPQYKIS